MTSEAEAWRRGAEAMRKLALSRVEAASHLHKLARFETPFTAALALASAAIKQAPIPDPPPDLLADGLCDRGA